MTTWLFDGQDLSHVNLDPETWEEIAKIQNGLWGYLAEGYVSNSSVDADIAESASKIVDALMWKVAGEHYKVNLP